jgi:1-aminocyclopropane-1-carboxylate deaminase
MIIYSLIDQLFWIFIVCVSKGLLSDRMARTRSIVSKAHIFGRQVYIMRDDLMNFYGLSGNKARKLKFLENDQHKALISYGGAQSNAMFALSEMSKRTNKEFFYVTNKLPKFLVDKPSGNLLNALRNGMKVILRSLFYI